MVKKIRYYLFLRDVLLLSLTAFGGPQAFFAMTMERMVKKRNYLNEKDLLELNALCQILPGPTSTQIISAIGFKIGGAYLAYLALIVWILPATILITLAAIFISSLQDKEASLAFTRFIQPMAVGFVIFAAHRIIITVIENVEGVVLMALATIITVNYNTPYIFPILLIAGGLATALKYKKHPKDETPKPIQIKWANFLLWGGVLAGAAIIGAYTQYRPILLFENFYRNGSLIFGGGQVLIPYLYTEFVEFKSYLSSEEFLSGYALMQSLPGPTFSFSSYIGALSLREYGLMGQITGSLVAAAGIFLPGTFLIFFVIRFWDGLKRYRVVRASLEGINAVSCGMVVAAAIIMFDPIEANLINLLIILITYFLLAFTKIPAPLVIIVGLAAGFILPS
nr:chromate efflux transporter [Penaeicola halotolerans]